MRTLFGTILSSRRGQSIAVEYVLTFFLVIAVIGGMSIYFRRTIQGRIRDSLHYMGNTVRSEYQGTFTKQYEPYYANTNAIREDNSTETRSLIPLQPGREIAVVNYGDNRRGASEVSTAAPNLISPGEEWQIPCYSTNAADCN